MKKILLFLCLWTLLFLTVSPALAAETFEEVTIALDTIWIMIAGFLVFLMHAGFSLVEIGFTRSKNTVNILMKNFLTIAIGAVTYFIIGFALMFGKDALGLIGTSGFFTNGFGEFDFGIPTLGFFFFQAVFAATSATILSGAVAERIKFSAYLILAIVIAGFTYPIVGHWIWGGGWLSSLGFIDLAGSTVVHSVGGWSALVAAYLLGSRIGKYDKDGKVNAIPGHNIPLGALGVLILWFGWFGFNPGSTLSGNAYNDIALIATNTLLAAACSTITSMLYSWIKYGKPDITFTLNGALAGLVAITAGALVVLPVGAVIIGSIAGVVLIISATFFDNVAKIDDPVGAISVHGVCGALGTILIGVFAAEGGLLYGGGLSLLGIQSIGVATVFFWVVTVTTIAVKIIDKLVGIRVSVEEEIEGLDIGEHGMSAYGEFLLNSSNTIHDNLSSSGVVALSGKSLISKAFEG
ncbi:MAG: ammonium transporter [Clostridia bacterium]|nr:ammonium transporter [Clostridia bacterium]